MSENDELKQVSPAASDYQQSFKIGQANVSAGSPFRRRDSPSRQPSDVSENRLPSGAQSPELRDNRQPFQAPQVPPSNDMDDGMDHYDFDQPKREQMAVEEFNKNFDEGQPTQMTHEQNFDNLLHGDHQ